MNATPPHLIPLHLSLSMINWQRSMSALSAANYVWPSLKKQEKNPHAPQPSNPALTQLVAQVAGNPKLASAVRAEAQKRLIRQVEGINLYYQSDYERELEDPEVVWEAGAARLLDYSEGDYDEAILLIPSLINSYHVLDLTEERSFARHLAQSNKAVYLLDWGEPSTTEKRWRCNDYITEHLSAIGDFLKGDLEHTHVTAVGHCMGGVLAMGLAAIRPDIVDALAPARHAMGFLGRCHAAP